MVIAEAALPAHGGDFFHSRLSFSKDIQVTPETDEKTDCGISNLYVSQTL